MWVLINSPCACVIRTTVHQLCLLAPFPAGWPRATCPGSSEAPQIRMLEHSSLRAPVQSLAGISAAVWLKDSVCRDKPHDKLIISNLPENPLLPTKLLGSQSILFIEKDRRVRKRLGRFPRFIITVLGHSYTEGCSPSCLWEVSIALVWVMYTLYHERVSGKALHSGGLILEDNHTALCSLWVTVLSHRVQKAKLEGRFTSPNTCVKAVGPLNVLEPFFCTAGNDREKYSFSPP